MDILKIIQISDCQIGFIEQNLSWQKDLDNMSACIKAINRLKPDCVIDCGDMAHGPVGTEIHANQKADYLKMLEEIDRGIPYQTLCGNHDAKGSPTFESILNFEKDFGKSYGSFSIKDTQILYLNSCIIHDSSQVQDLYNEQWLWLEKAIDKDAQYRLLFMHHPFFRDSIDEEDHYYSLPKAERIKHLELLNDCNVNMCFSGHLHHNLQNSYQGIELITTSAVGKPLGNDPCGMRLIEISDRGIDHHFMSLEELMLKNALS